MKSSNSGEKTILIVETSLLFSSIVKKLLGKAGLYNIISSSDELDASIKLGKYNVKLLIIGHNMSFGASLKLVNHIKSNKILANIPMLKISSNLSINNSYNLVKAGVNDIITLNEFDHNVFLSKIAGLLKDDILLKLIQKQSVSTRLETDASILSPKVADSKKSEQEPFVKEMVTPEKFEQKLMQINTIKTVPFVITQLLSMTSSLNTEIDDIANLIKTDNALTAKVLKLANSVFYNRLSNRIYNLKDAIKAIGFLGIKDIALAVGTITKFDQNPDQTTLNRINLWYYSFTSGIIATRIADSIKYPHAETCFVASLLNNIGIAILDDYLHEELKQVLEVSIYYNLPFSKVEKKLLGVRHNEVSAKVLRLWNFPKSIVVPISLSDLSYNDIINLKPVFNDFKKDALILKLSDQMAKVLTGGLFKNDIVEDIPAEVFDSSYLDLDINRFKSSLKDVEDNVKDIMEKTYTTINLENILQNSYTNTCSSAKPLKTVVLKENCNKMFILEAILENLDFEVSYHSLDNIKNISKLFPDLMILDFDNPENISNYINTIKSILQTTSISIVISVPKKAISLLQKLLGFNNKLIYLPRPYMLYDIHNFIDFISFSSKILVQK